MSDIPIPTPLFLTARGTDQLRPWTVSYSQLSLVESCQRKWWFKYVKQMPDPTGAGAAFGSKLHSLAEKRITENVELTDDRIGRLVGLSEARGYTPTHAEFLAANGKIKIEHKFKAFMGHGVDALPLTGAVDILDMSKPDVVYVNDHKTGKSLRYTKTEEQLRLDQQLSIYLKAAVEEFYEGKPPARLEAAHTVYLSEGPFHVERTGPVSIPWEQVQSTWSGIEKQVPVIRGLAVETAVNKIPGNRARCNDYGGCPFRDVCHGTLDSTTFSTPNTPNTPKTAPKEDPAMDQPMTPMQRLKMLQDRNKASSMNPGRNGQAPAEVVQTPVVPVAAPAPAPVVTEQELIARQMAAEAREQEVAAKKLTLEEYQKNFKVPAPAPAPAANHTDARKFSKEEVAEARAQEAAEKAEAPNIGTLSKEAVLYALAKRGFTEQQIARASVATVATIMDEGYGAEDCSILPNGSLKVFKPMEGTADRSIDPVRAEQRKAVQDAADEQLRDEEQAQAEDAERARTVRNADLERQAEEAERVRVAALKAEEAERVRVAALKAEAQRLLDEADAKPPTNPATNGESFGYTHVDGVPLKPAPTTPVAHTFPIEGRVRKPRGSKQLLVERLKLYSLKEYDDMSVESAEAVFADVERQLREGAGAPGAPPVIRPIFRGMVNTPERKEEIEADERYRALAMMDMPTMDQWNAVGVVGFVWRHGEKKLTHYTELEHFLRDLCRKGEGSFALDFGPDQANRRKFIQADLELLPGVLRAAYQSFVSEQKAVGSGAQAADTFEAPPKVTQEEIQTLTTQMGGCVFILVDASAEWALPMEKHLLPAMQGYEQKKKVPYYDLLPYNEGGKLMAACLMLEEFALTAGNWYSICGAHPWRQYVMEVLIRDPRVRFIYGTR